MGMMGACRRHELHQMKITNFTDLGSAVLVTIPDTKTKIIRSFTVTSPYYEIYKKYANLRPSYANGPWFFINYQRGKCTAQRSGVNKLGGMGKEIAKYLKLPNHELYTGHCFRRSSATILVDAGGDITNLKLHGGLKSTAFAEGYIEKAEKNAVQSISNVPSPSSRLENRQREEVVEESHDFHENKSIFSPSDEELRESAGISGRRMPIGKSSNLDEFQETISSEVQHKRCSRFPVEIDTVSGEELRRTKRIKIEEEVDTSNQIVKDARKDIDPLISNWGKLLVYKIQELDENTRKSAMLQIDELIHHIIMRTMIEKSMEATIPSLASKDNHSSCEKRSREDVGSNTPYEATNSDRLIESYATEEIKIEYNEIELDEESVQTPLKLKEESLAKSEFDAREIKIEYEEESESDSKEMKTEYNENDEESVKIPFETKEESLEEEVEIEYEESYFRENEIEYNEIELDEEVVKIQLEAKEVSLAESEFDAKGVKIECEEYSESDSSEI